MKTLGANGQWRRYAHTTQRSTGQPCHPSMKPVIRSTELRRWLSSRARPGPDRSANAAAPSVRRRETSTCGGTIVPPVRPPYSSSSPPPLLRRAAERAGLGMSTGRERPARRGVPSGAPPARTGVPQSRAGDELQLGGAGASSSWGASGHSTSTSQNSSALVAIAVERCVDRSIRVACGGQKVLERRMGAGVLEGAYIYRRGVFASGCAW